MGQGLQEKTKPRLLLPELTDPLKPLPVLHYRGCLQKSCL